MSEREPIQAARHAFLSAPVAAGTQVPDTCFAVLDPLTRPTHICGKPYGDPIHGRQARADLRENAEISRMWSGRADHLVDSMDDPDLWPRLQR